MTKIQLLSDKTAMGLSLLCTFHCLALPIILVLFPSIASLQLNNEALHLWMVLIVIPISIYALTIGCKQHKRLYLLTVGALGLILLLLALFIPEPNLGEFGEKILTSTGAVIIALAHYINYRLCQHDDSCACPKHQP